MEKVLNGYLEKMEKYLKPIAVSERVDIINEIKSEMQELQTSRVSAEKIIERLGDPKDLERAYLGDLLSKESRFSWSRFLIICAFYRVVGFSGMFVIPCLGLIAPAFIICGIATPLIGAVKMIDYIFELNLPYMENIGVFVGESIKFNPITEFFICLITGGTYLFRRMGSMESVGTLLQKSRKNCKKAIQFLTLYKVF